MRDEIVCLDIRSLRYSIIRKLLVLITCHKLTGIPTLQLLVTKKPYYYLYLAGNIRQTLVVTKIQQNFFNQFLCVH